MKTLLVALGLLLVPVLSEAAGQNTLTWTDNSDNETSFNIERTTATGVAACQTATGFTQIVTVPSNTTTFTDTVVNEGTTYCYRVKAANSAGSSAPSNIAGRLVPFTIPVAPSGLTVGQ